VEAFVGRIDLGGAFRFPSVVEEILGTSPGRISQADFGPAHVDVAYVESRHLKDAEKVAQEIPEIKPGFRFSSVRNTPFQ